MPLEDANPNSEAGENRNLEGDGDSNCPIRKPTLAEEPNAHKYVDLSKLVVAVEQQTEQLRSMNAQHTELFRSMIGQLKSLDERQAAADTSMKPIPQLPANSSSAWMALWQSFKDQVNPAVERLRGGLDALLVFIGLFSAIVTAFLVDSAKNLEPDEASRTNNLLANLTEIVLAISGTQFANLSLPYEATFAPEASDVRPNTYWFISLVISLLVAAISVVCRGFLTSILETTLKSASPSLALTEVYERWQNAEHYLKPVAESVPQMMVLPVILFVLGLLDTLFSLNSHLVESSSGLVVAFALSCALALFTVVVLLFFLAHGVKFPGTSPFQSLFSNLLSDKLPYLRKASQPYKNESTVNPSRELSERERTTFSSILQITREDSVLEQGSAILEQALLQMRPSEFDCWRDPPEPRWIPARAVKVLAYILSPEASFRSNLTAAEFIPELFVWGNRYEVTDDDAIRLLHSCIDLAQRIKSTRGSRALLDSGALRAICSIVKANYDFSLLGIPDVFRLLFWENTSHVNEQLSEQLMDLSFNIAGTYSSEGIKTNMDLIWSSYGGIAQVSDVQDFTWESPARTIISRCLRVHYRMNRFQAYSEFCQNVLQKVVGVLSLDQQIYLLTPLSKIRVPEEDKKFVPFMLKTLHDESLQKAGDLHKLDASLLTDCTKALSVIGREVLKSYPHFFPSYYYQSFLYLVELALLVFGHQSSEDTPDLKETAIQLLHSVYAPFRQGIFDVEELGKTLGPLVSSCLRLWPDMRVPIRALEDDFKIEYYPLLDGWERTVIDGESLFYNKHTDSATKDFPGSPAHPTEITPADIMLPEDVYYVSSRVGWFTPGWLDDKHSSYKAYEDLRGYEFNYDLLVGVQKDEPSGHKSRFSAMTGHVLQLFRGIHSSRTNRDRESVGWGDSGASGA